MANDMGPAPAVFLDRVLDENPQHIKVGVLVRLIEDFAKVIGGPEESLHLSVVHGIAQKTNQIVVHTGRRHVKALDCCQGIDAHKTPKVLCKVHAVLGVQYRQIIPPGGALTIVHTLELCIV